MSLYSTLLILLVCCIILHTTQAHNYCIYKTTKEQCDYISGQCIWDDNMCKMKVNQCKYAKTYTNCRTSYQTDALNIACSWKHGNCVQANQCNEIHDVENCRNAGFSQRCQVTLNGKSSNDQKTLQISQMFNDYKCVVQDCKYLSSNYYSCPQFVNGRRCFNQNGCTQCSYQTTAKLCLMSNNCTWSQNENYCRNIMCNQLSSPQLCSAHSFCEWNSQQLYCQNNSQIKNSYCYNYDVKGNNLVVVKEEIIID